ncbi:MAG: hypothetical protein BWX88_04457 [Planctomycetes bacterium ADurb.Bin126]|nr:MAG: hypothetical protein BWX88_04457 [Planctomycetes bacterium ADurb.Bin126]HOD82545.1 BatA domain-containing protein [Phycisphaerae bacterium]HQL74952.1 BatA domain-containing protein [Phycisphaerae bacterium]
MTALAFGFATPLLLLGLLATVIPFILHLLSSVKAQEVFFPTLRFLKRSMEKTARRRRIQNWLLLLLRAGLLALLAFAVSEPLTKTAGSWFSGQRYAAVVILDNSMSMAAMSGSSSRFSQARDQAASLLSGENMPTMAALITTNGGWVSPEMTAELEPLREQITRSNIGAGAAAILRPVQDALDMLEKQTLPRRAIYIFSDLQVLSFEQMVLAQDLARAKDVHLLVVNTGSGSVDNVGITDLEVIGQRVVNSLLEFKVTLTNSSAIDKTVDVGLRVGGQAVGAKISKSLARSGEAGSSATLTFRHRFTSSGPASGEIYIEQGDQLAQDNVRRFCLRIGGRVKVLVVRGYSDPADSPSMDPAMALLAALDPYAGAGDAPPWPIQASVIEADNFASTSLAGMDAVYFCEMPAFSADQAKAVAGFVQEGRTACFFLGPNCNANNYNEILLDGIKDEGGLLPARIGEPTGEVSLEADAFTVDWVDVSHDYFKGLMQEMADYLTMQVHRYYKLTATPTPGQTLIRLAGGDPLAVTKRFGRGRVLMFASTCSPRWGSIYVAPVFLPMVHRASLLARVSQRGDDMFLAGSPAIIWPEGLPNTDPLNIQVTLPLDAPNPGAVVSVPVRRTTEGAMARFEQTTALGVYKWKLIADRPLDDTPAGQFVVNGDGRESNLASYTAEAFTAAMQRAPRNLQNVHVAANLDAVNEAASLAAEGHNWWDFAAIFAILFLVLEALVANRGKAKVEEAIPDHLNPKMAA